MESSCACIYIYTYVRRHGVQERSRTNAREMPLAREFSYLYSCFSSIVPTCSRTAHLSTRHSATADPGNELKWVWNNRGAGPVPRRLERGGRIRRAEKESQITRRNGRERERKEEQGPYESKDEVGEGATSGGRGRTLWRARVYVRGMGELGARVRYLAR